MEPADGAQCHQADARRHGGARCLRGVPSALHSHAEIRRRPDPLMRSVLIGLFLAIGLPGSPNPGHAGQSPASGAGRAAPDNGSDPAPTSQSAHDPRAVFAPLTLPEPANRYRSANGAPGPDYWQNRADYAITAQLDPKTKRVSGIVTITYTNNSPDRLDVLWLQLDQNIYRRDARAVVASG